MPDHRGIASDTVCSQARLCWDALLLLEYVGEYHNELCELVLTLLIAGHAVRSEGWAHLKHSESGWIKNWLGAR